VNHWSEIRSRIALTSPGILVDPQTRAVAPRGLRLRRKSRELWLEALPHELARATDGLEDGAEVGRPDRVGLQLGRRSPATLHEPCALKDLAAGSDLLDDVGAAHAAHVSPSPLTARPRAA
jgi:hypothetical protein